MDTFIKSLTEGGHGGKVFLFFIALDGGGTVHREEQVWSEPVSMEVAEAFLEAEETNWDTCGDDVYNMNPGESPYATRGQGYTFAMVAKDESGKEVKMMKLRGREVTEEAVDNVFETSRTNWDCVGPSDFSGYESVEESEDHSAHGHLKAQLDKVIDEIKSRMDNPEDDPMDWATQEELDEIRRLQKRMHRHRNR